MFTEPAWVPGVLPYLAFVMSSFRNKLSIFVSAFRLWIASVKRSERSPGSSIVLFFLLSVYFFSCVPLSESLKLANFDQIQVAFKHWCYLNGEWGRKNEHRVGGNKKWEQSRELEMKLLIGLRFKAGFLPICHFPIPRARPLLHVPVACVQTSPISFVCVCNKGNRGRLHAGNVPRFNNILLNTIFQLDRILCFVKKWRFAFSDRRNSRLALLQ